MAGDANAGLGSLLTEAVTITVDSSNAVDITERDYRRNHFLTIDEDGGDPADGPITASVPAIRRGLFTVINATAFDVTMGISGQSESSPVVAAGGVALLASDGVNVRQPAGGSGNGAQSPIIGAAQNIFQWNIINDAGTLKHFFNNPSDGTAAAPLIGGINSPQGPAAAAIATGADASTAFTGGAKVSTGATNRIIFDTADLTDSGLVAMITAMSFNSEGAALLAKLAVTSRDVNGVTRERLEVSLTNAASGAAYAINTTNLGAGQQLSIQFHGYMPNYS